VKTTLDDKGQIAIPEQIQAADGITSSRLVKDIEAQTP
jgi:hypothetical protein